MVDPAEAEAEFAREVESHHRGSWEQFGCCYACHGGAPEYCVCERVRRHLEAAPEERAEHLAVEADMIAGEEAR